MRISQNIAAFNAYRNLSTSDIALRESLEKLPSGFRINRAVDDAAGLVKSESLRSEIRDNRQAIRNAQDDVSFVQAVEGALNEVHSILQRMRELAVDAANTATTDGTAQQAEFDELLLMLDAVSGLGAALRSQVGANSGDTMEIVSDLAPAQPYVFCTDIGAVDVSVDDDTAITTLDGAIDSVSDERATLGAIQSRLESVIANLDVTVENLSASESGVLDVELVNFTRNQIMTQAGTAM